MSFKTIDPFHDQVLSTFEHHSLADVYNKIEGLNLSFLSWRQTSIDERKAYFHALAVEFKNQRNEIALQITREIGKPITEALAELDKSTSGIVYYADHALEIMRSSIFHQNDLKAEVSLEPLGIIWAIMPWNYPVWQFVRCAIPALLTGNVILFKPSELTAGTSELLAQCFGRASAATQSPAGLVEVVHCPHELSPKILAHSAVQGVSFTGSVRGGREVAGLAGANLKKSVMELGGSDAYIILKDADLDYAMELCTRARLVNCGQSCVAAKRFFVDESLHAVFLKKMQEHMLKLEIGDPQLATTQLGPLANKKFVTELRAQVAPYAHQIFFQRADNPSVDRFFPSTILDLGPIKNIEINDQTYKPWDQEFFGPVACVWSFTENEAAIAAANHCKFGLGGAVFSRDSELAAKLGRQLECGMVAINDMVKSDVRLPFGGVKDSGYGRELSAWAALEFCNLKVLRTL